MTPLPGRSMGITFRRPMLVIALFAASLLTTNASTAGASNASLPVVQEVAAGPAFKFGNFRWAGEKTVEVYYNWDGGACVFGGNDFSGPESPLPMSVLTETLRSSVAEINENLNGALTLEFKGPATRAQLCDSSAEPDIVVGVGTLEAAGQALSYGHLRAGTFAVYTAARVFVSNTAPFTCRDAPVYRDLRHTLTHELLHAVGIGHSEEPGVLMAPTFSVCRSGYAMQDDDVAALAALYPPKQPVIAVTPVPAGAGGFLTRVVYAPNGQALAVFPGGSAEQLEAAARSVNAQGVWVQDRTGQFHLLVVNGPNFLRDQFREAFLQGVPTNTAVTLAQ